MTRQCRYAATVESLACKPRPRGAPRAARGRREGCGEDVHCRCRGARGRRAEGGGPSCGSCRPAAVRPWCSCARPGRTPTAPYTSLFDLIVARSHYSERAAAKIFHAIVDSLLELPLAPATRRLSSTSPLPGGAVLRCVATTSRRPRGVHRATRRRPARELDASTGVPACPPLSTNPPPLGLLRTATAAPSPTSAQHRRRR